MHEKVPVIEVSGRTFPVQVVYEPLGTAPALMREVPGFAVGARPGDADYDELASAIAESDSTGPAAGPVPPMPMTASPICLPPWLKPAPSW